MTTTMTSVAETNKHYDRDPEIFAQFLDPRMKYSSGIYESPTDSLECAQSRKLKFMADQLGLTDGRRLLDVGCGWGALTLYAAVERNCEVVAVTPAPRQRDYIVSLADKLGVTDSVTVLTTRIETAALERNTFDGVAMVGMSTHMPNIASVMRRIWPALRWDGALYLSDTCYRNSALRQEFHMRPGTKFVRETVLGSGTMRPLSVLVQAVEEAGFAIAGMRDLTDDYRLTVDAWAENVAKNATTLDAMCEGLSTELTRYFETANAGWGYTIRHYGMTCRKTR